MTISNLKWVKLIILYLAYCDRIIRNKLAIYKLFSLAKIIFAVFLCHVVFASPFVSSLLATRHRQPAGTIQRWQSYIKHWVRQLNGLLSLWTAPETQYKFSFVKAHLPTEIPLQIGPNVTASNTFNEYSKRHVLCEVIWTDREPQNSDGVRWYATSTPQGHLYYFIFMSRRGALSQWV